jgi:hypothetical protein
LKRGLITWDKSEIPAVVFEQRVHRVRRMLADRDLAALVVYSELWRSNQARFFCNFMPYFNRALLVIPRAAPLTLFCGLSPRVYGWIQSVTTITDVRPAGNFAKPLFDLAAEKQWRRIGALDFNRFPYDIFKALQTGSINWSNVDPSAVFVPSEDRTEMTIRRKALALAHKILEEEIPKGIGVVDYHFVGTLERRFRKAGAEDLVILVTNGSTAPAIPTGATLEATFSVSLALEYRGHWVRISRHGLAKTTRSAASYKEEKIHAERLDSSYPYECGLGKIMAQHTEYIIDGKRLFYGDTIL